uniref:hypothetical protein n=1 Tax=Candidatus Fimivicinus sp. TaxID=3056640 RepID=UPI004027DE3D
MKCESHLFYHTGKASPCEKWRCRSAACIFPMLPSFKAGNFATRLKLFYHTLMIRAIEEMLRGYCQTGYKW